MITGSVLSDNCNAGDLIKYFVNKGRGYKIITTSSSTKIGDDQEIYIIGSGYVGKGMLRLMNQIKIDIYKQLNGASVEEIKPRWYSVNRDKFILDSGFIETITEIDLKSAYLEEAYYRKFLSKKMYDRLNVVSKKTRHKVMGSIATKKTIRTYNNKNELVDTELQYDETLRNVWNWICYGVDCRIKKLIKLNGESNFVFYWLDNLFVEKNIKDVLLDEKIPARVLDTALIYTKKLNHLFINTADKRQFNIHITDTF